MAATSPATIPTAPKRTRSGGPRLARRPGRARATRWPGPARDASRENAMRHQPGLEHSQHQEDEEDQVQRRRDGDGRHAGPAPPAPGQQAARLHPRRSEHDGEDQTWRLPPGAAQPPSLPARAEPEATWPERRRPRAAIKRRRCRARPGRMLDAIAGDDANASAKQAIA